MAHESDSPVITEPLGSTRRMPHPAVLTGFALALLALLCFSMVLQEAGSIDVAGPMPIVAMAVTLVVTAVYSAILLSHPRFRTVATASIALLVIDAAAPVFQLTAADPSAARVYAGLFALPTIIAAASLPRWAFRSQLTIAVVVSTAMLAIPFNGRIVAQVLLEVGIAVSVLTVSAVTVRRVSRTTKNHIDQLRTLALTDVLTGALNRRGLADSYRAFQNQAARRGDSIGVISLDIDHFKWFNDTYGHPAGDEVLKLVTQALREAGGPASLVARTGGEELVVLVRRDAEAVAEQVRELLAQTAEPRVTASIGVVDVPAERVPDEEHLWRLLDAADKAMYTAKTTGRDRICRGSFRPHDTISVPRVPAPQEAAVPLPEVEAASTASAFPGWVLAAAAAGAIAYFLFVLQTSWITNKVDDLYFTVLVMLLVVGLILAAMGPLVDRFRWATGIVGTDLVVFLTITATADVLGQIILLMALLLPGVMVAQHFSRRTLMAHHAAVLATGMTVPVLTPVIGVLTGGFFAAVSVIVSAELIHFLQERSYAAAADLHRWSVTDPLTGLANRHGLELGFDNLSRAQQLTVLAIDVDDFKSINDTHGHAAGDDALVRLAQTLRTVSGKDTVVCRTGGDEFIVLAPNTRPSALTSRVKRAAALLPLPLSVSIGSAVAAPRRLRSLWLLVDAADAALIRAKRSRKQQRRVTSPHDRLQPQQPEAVHQLEDLETPRDARPTSGPSEADRAELDQRDFGAQVASAGAAPDQSDSNQAAASAVSASRDGSASSTSTTTSSPSAIDPASSSRAS